MKDMSVNIFIPSKDRACQLHILLESLQCNAPGLFKSTVLYKASNNVFRDGYNKLMERFPNVRWTYEYDSTKQFYHFLRENEIVGLFADDCIFYRKTDIEEYKIRHYLNELFLWSFSFRHGQNVSVNDYISGRLNKLPKEYFIEDGFLQWNYREGFSNLWESSFSFALGFDGCFYRSDNLLFLTEGNDFGGITNWENFICHNGRFDLVEDDWMVSPQFSCVFAQQINNTHERSLTSKGYRRNLKELNDLYLDDYVIDLDSMDFSNVSSTHDEIPFAMRKYNE